MLNNLKLESQPFNLSDLNIVRLDRANFESCLGKCFTVQLEG